MLAPPSKVLKVWSKIQKKVNKTPTILTIAKNKIEIDFNALSEIVNDFEILQQNYKWGTNLPYMVSGANSLPQKEVMEWVTNRFYSINSIVRALENQSKGVLDNLKLPLVESGKKFESAIIIGGGPNSQLHANAVKEFIKKQKVFVEKKNKEEWSHNIHDILNTQIDAIDMILEFIKEKWN